MKIVVRVFQLNAFDFSYSIARSLFLPQFCIKHKYDTMKNALKFLAVLLLLMSNSSFGQDVSNRIDSIIKNNYENNPDVGISVGFIHNNEEYYTA